MREERLLNIVELLKKQGYTTTQELARHLGVSDSTIRRDVAELVKRNVAVCTKSGVAPVPEGASDMSLHFRSKVNSRVKAALAWEAASLVKEGSAVYLDSSTTVLPLASALSAMRNVTVITNGLLTARHLRGSGASVYLIGGRMSKLSYGFYGPAAEEAMLRFSFDLAFFSPVGITPQNYAVETVEEAAAIRIAAMRQAQHSVLLFDHTKIGLVRPFNFAHLSEFDHLVTDDAKFRFDSEATIHHVRL